MPFVDIISTYLMPIYAFTFAQYEKENPSETSFTKFDQKSQTYDVTESVKGLHYDLFLIMQKQLNFTSTFHKRKDGKWGPTTIFQNGTVITGGIIESVASGFAEILVSG